MKTIFIFSVIVVCMVSPGSLMATEEPGCKQFTDKEINFIKSSQNPKLLTGAGLIDLIDPASGLSKEFLDSASRIESPKGLGTFSSIDFDFDRPWVESPLKSSTRENILKLVTDDKDNAQSYYVNAILQAETAGDKEAIKQIKIGNTKTFKTYSKQRFDAILDAAELAKCKGVQARQYAFSRFFVTNTYSKLRHLCRKLVKNNDQEAKNACYDMGKNLERGSLAFVEQLISLGIQSTAFGESPSDTSVLKEIKDKREKITDVMGRNADVSESDIPENIGLQYYQILLDKGEASAQDFIADYVKQKHQRN